MTIRSHIRWMIRRDLKEVLLIENKCFSEEAWQEVDFIRTLRVRNCIGMVLEIGEKIVGYMLYELHKGKLEIVRIAVDPYYQRRGLGSQMLKKLQSKLTDHNRNRIRFDVPEGMTSVHLWLQANRFDATGCVGDEKEFYRFIHRLPEEALIKV